MSGPCKYINPSLKYPLLCRRAGRRSRSDRRKRRRRITLIVRTRPDQDRERMCHLFKEEVPFEQDHSSPCFSGGKKHVTV